MKKAIILAALMSLAGYGHSVFADEAHHPAQDEKAAASTVDKATTDTGKPMERMHENMQKMQAQMQKIMQTKDPKEREKLLNEHWQSMHDAMKTMRGMGGGMKMSGGGKAGGMMDGGMMGGSGKTQSRMMSGDMMGGGKMMEDRMDMMQMMMEQMMEHMGAMEAR